MDYDERKRHQMMRVLIAEAGMVISVIVIVIVSVMLAMGYFIADDGNIEQSGLLQLHSLPTGATVNIDGDTLFSRTNLSRTLAKGSHEIKLSRDGYDTWEKNISMEAGRLYRLFYPRLFRENRDTEEVLTIVDQAADNSALEFFTPAKSRKYILYMLKNSSEWHLVDLKSDSPKETILDLSGFLPGMELSKTETESSKNSQNQVLTEADTENHQFNGEILKLEWSANDEKVLLKIRVEEKIQWVLINLKDLEKSNNLTKTFGLDFDEMSMADDNASQIYALSGGQIRMINADSNTMSKVLLTEVKDFVNYKTNILFLTKSSAGAQEIRTYRDGDEGSVVIGAAEADAKVKLAFARYYDEDYLAYTADDLLSIYYGQLPHYKKDGEQDLSEIKEFLLNEKLEVLPQSIMASPDGGYIALQNQRNFIVMDLESGELNSYEAATEEMNWLDASMFYGVVNHEILVWDFDGSNLRNLSESQKKNESVEVLDNNIVISANNRWLYYLANVQDGAKKSLALMREKILD